jgi:CHAT domain-containing protein
MSYTSIPPCDFDSLAAELVSCPIAERMNWIRLNKACVSRHLVEALKLYSYNRLHSALSEAANTIQCIYLVADCLPDDPLAHAIASWAEGNVENFREPQRAIDLYQQALRLYETEEPGSINVARLHSNLVAPLTECGRFPEAHSHYEQARVILGKASDNDSAFYLLALEQNYGWLLHTQGLYVEALEVHARAFDLASRLQRPEDQAEIEVNRTLSYGMVGQLSKGEAALLQCRETLRQLNHGFTVARIEMNIGELYAAFGRPAEALRAFHAARAGFQSQGIPMEEGSVLLREGLLLERLGALREALKAYELARQQFEQRKMAPQVGVALLREAAANRRYGRPERVGPLLDAAEQLWQELNHTAGRAAVIQQRIELALAQHDGPLALALCEDPLLMLKDSGILPAERAVMHADVLALCWNTTGQSEQRTQALAIYTEVLKEAEAQGLRWLLRRALVGRGSITLEEDLSVARKDLEQAAEQDDIIRQSLSVEELKASFQAQTSEALPRLAQLELRAGRSHAALQAIWRAKGSALLEIMGRNRTSASDIDEQILQARQQLAATRWQRALENTLEQPEAERERADHSIRDLEEYLISLRRQRNTEQGSPTILLQTDPVLLLRTMSADILVEYIIADQALIAVRADRDGTVQVVEIPQLSEVRRIMTRLGLKLQTVVRYGNPAHRIAMHNVWLAETLPLLNRCYEILISPLGPFPPNARVLIAPCDLLHLLPFAALWDGQKYLVESITIEMMPTGALLAAPLQRPLTDGVTLIIADTANGQLPGVRTQAEIIQSLSSRSICLIDDPGSLAYLAALSSPPKRLHIAAHHIQRSNDAPIFSALRLPGGPLSVEQVYELPLDGTELVTLSGCTTAAGLDTGGAILAFQSALFSAGARQIVSSLWAVHDQDTAHWMTTFYKLLSTDIDAAEALRATQLALLSQSVYAHPAVWAAFSISRQG